MTKQDVFNPLSLANTPGTELACIFETHQVFDYNDRLGLTDLREKEHLSKKLIKEAEKILSMERDLLEYLSQTETRYKEHKQKSRISYAVAKKQFTKFKPILRLLKDEFTDGYDRLNDVLDYFDVDSPEDVFEHSERQAALYRKQNGIEPDPINLYGWLRRGELDFSKMNLPDYDEKGLRDWIDKREWEHHLTDVDYFKSLPEVLSKFGVGLSLVPHLANAYSGDNHPGIPAITTQFFKHGRSLCA